MKKHTLLILASLLISFNVNAATITTFMFSGVIDRVVDDNTVLNGEISIGTEFTGYFTYNYDRSIPENSSFSDDPTVAFYPVITDTRLYIGGLFIEGDNRHMPRSVQIWNDKDSGWPHMDAFSISSGLDYSPPFNLGSGNTLTASYTASFWDTSGNLIDSDILPSPEQIAMQNFDRNSFSITALNHDEYRAYNDGLATDYTSLHIYGDILTVQTVPLPAAFYLFISGLFVLIMQSRKSSKN
ncbi:MAG TPA: hypothetical protein VIQ81_00285 [Gammaproteobacteria bacterium]